MNKNLVERYTHKQLESYLKKRPIRGGMDGVFYNDLREPFIGSDITAVTLTTTAKALYPVANFPVLGGQYFARIGKALKIKLWLKLVMGATPGNFSFNILWGSGADANGTVLVTGTPVALTASVTKCGYMECIVRCTAIGAAGVGALECTGFAHFDPAVIASTLQPILLPTAGAAPVNVDLTTAFIVSVQALQSGTAGTAQVQQMEVTALN